jgi:hypothetical protein
MALFAVNIFQINIKHSKKYMDYYIFELQKKKKKKQFANIKSKNCKLSLFISEITRQTLLDRAD